MWWLAEGNFSVPNIYIISDFYGHNLSSSDANFQYVIAMHSATKQKTSNWFHQLMENSVQATKALNLDRVDWALTVLTS